ncbi:unnamed protein product, partial [Mesorhabditis belari]|uniref:TLC domain-containing protein n=1 Tax=Mesorhabditis belari TaxID=2138241 RepID=A0AAF3EA28_9BILA
MENMDDVLRVHRAEFEYPPWEKFLEKKYLLPVVCYFLVWRLLARFVSTYLWKDYQGFRQYRLRNLSICFLHSLFTGSAALIFSFVNIKIMLEDPLHWWDDSCAHIFFLSIGYFVHDALDMLSHEWSKWMLELLFHHFMTIFVFSVQLSTQKFQPYAFWALLMEVSSVFLHSRSLLQLSGASERNPRLFRGFLWMNLFAFIAFRFCVQTWQIWWVVTNHKRIASFYFGVGFFGGFIFLTINCFLFYRVLCSDGFLGEKRRNALSNRDKQTFVKALDNSDKSL